MSDLSELEKALWSAADNLRANSKLRSSEYSVPVLGLIFLRFADFKFSQAQAEIAGKGTGRYQPGKEAYQARNVLFLPDHARYDHLLRLPDDADLGKAINAAMDAIEEANEDLRGVLPKVYNRFEDSMLAALLKTFNFSPERLEGDVFGQIYEYFLGKFAMSEGQKGGEFFTPTALVKLIVEIIEPYHGRILDPACGSGGMFVQSAKFVQRHNAEPAAEISLYGQEKTEETVRLAKMNLAVHGLSGDIREGNTYYDDIHESAGRFDYVMANPPFNVDKVDKSRAKKDPRFPFGIPSVDNANYLWIQLFYSALNERGRAGFVMANSASDARHSELELRKALLHERAVDVMVAIGSNFFYTVTLPCTLWFLDRGKRGTAREDQVLFIDARNIYRQLDRAHRDFAPDQLEFLANIARLYRGEAPELDEGSDLMLEETFPEGQYADVPGLCRVATLDEIAAQGYSLNPGRYVGVASATQPDDYDFKRRMAEIHERLERLNAEARELENRISENMRKLLDQ